mmetsp:Transcript_39690/g.86643  ORF Transcript_39690/g.86643 Transcript_39690/m.86643 type:complete len:243 (-) Transcript_39690:2571-3299(-)
MSPAQDPLPVEKLKGAQGAQGALNHLFLEGLTLHRLLLQQAGRLLPAPWGLSEDTIQSTEDPPCSGLVAPAARQCTTLTEGDDFALLAEAIIALVGVAGRLAIHRVRVREALVILIRDSREDGLDAVTRLEDSAGGDLLIRLSIDVAIGAARPAPRLALLLALMLTASTAVAVLVRAEHDTLAHALAHFRPGLETLKAAWPKDTVEAVHDLDAWNVPICTLSGAAMTALDLEALFAGLGLVV